MPRRPVPAEIAEAAAEHARTHGIDEFSERLLGRPGARSSTVTITWDADPQLGGFIRCRRCPDGFDHYLVAVEREEPTEHLIGLIVQHFAAQHPEVDFTPQAIWHDRNRPQEPLASFMPMVAQVGASIICAHCPEGMNHVFLTPPPYRDARRLHYLLSHHPELREQTRGFSSREQADYLEAWDRRLLQERERHAGRAALRQAKAKTKTADLTRTEQALASILRQRVNQGERITPVIEQLARQAKHDPLAFTCAIGEALPELAGRMQNATAREFAADVTSHLGERPTIHERRLWEIWAKAK